MISYLTIHYPPSLHFSGHFDWHDLLAVFSSWKIGRNHIRKFLVHGKPQYYKKKNLKYLPPRYPEQCQEYIPLPGFPF